MKKSLILSENDTEIIDKDKNSIFLTNFEFLIKENIFKSVGEINIEDTWK